MIYYDATCTICRKNFRIEEGTSQYKMYKLNPHGKFSCDQCKRKIEDDSRKYLFNRD